MKNLPIHAIESLCDKYAKKCHCIYEIEKSKTTNSIYIRFYLSKQGNKFTIRISDHVANRRRYRGASINSFTKKTLIRLEDMIKGKLRKHMQIRVHQILKEIKEKDFEIL